MPDLGTRLLPDVFDPQLAWPVKGAAFQAVGFGGVHGFSVLNKPKVWREIKRVSHVGHTVCDIYKIGAFRM